MAEVIPIRVKVEPENVEQTKRKIDRELTSVERRASRTGQRVSREMNRGFEGLLQNLNAVRLGLIAIGGYLTGRFGGAVLDVNRRLEVLRANLVGVTGSVEAANLQFSQLQDFATTLPFTLEEITSSFIKLANFGIEPTQELLRNFANISASLGKTLDQFTEAVLDATTGEFERLKEFGIRSRNLGNEIEFTFRGVTETVEFSSEAIIGYLNELGETEFIGSVERQMDTLNGALINLEDNWSRFLDTIADEEKIATVINFFSKTIELVTRLTEKLRTMNTTEEEAIFLLRQRQAEQQGIILRRIPQGQEPPGTAGGVTTAPAPGARPGGRRGRTGFENFFAELDQYERVLRDLDERRIERAEEAQIDSWQALANKRLDLQSRTNDILIQQEQERLNESTRVVETGLASWERGFENFVTTGKLSFSGLIDGMIADLARLGVNRIFQLLISGPGGAGSGGGLSGIFAGLFANAKGNVVQRYASGGLIDRPTIFPARRGLALAGEAGAEAIMPLQRDSRGNLGVSGGTAGTVNNYYINAIDTQSFADAARRSGAIPGLVAESIEGNKGMRKAILGAR